MNTNDLQTIADSRFNHLVFRKNLRERIAAQLIVTHHGGMFVASKDLISFLHCWESDDVFLEDTYGNPIKCNRTTLLVELKQAYQYAMNAWHVEFTESKSIRKATDV